MAAMTSRANHQYLPFCLLCCLLASISVQPPSTAFLPVCLTIAFCILTDNVSKAEYFPINRPPLVDHKIIIGDSKSLDPNAANKINDEFVRVETTTRDGKKHTEFHAAVVPKPDVVARSKHNTGIPVNVMIVGIDTVSNAHFQRALPDAYRYLTDELKSIIMKGYTIVGDGTTPALTAFLTGE